MLEKVAEETGENEERNGQNKVKQEIVRLNEKIQKVEEGVGTQKRGPLYKTGGESSRSTKFL